MEIIKSYEKGMNLQEILGLLSYKKVRPKELQKKNTRITNVHGSMKNNDILAWVEEIAKGKGKKNCGKVREETKKKQEKEKFYRCKAKCVCDSSDSDENDVESDKEKTHHPQGLQEKHEKICNLQWKKIKSKANGMESFVVARKSDFVCCLYFDEGVVSW